MKKIFLALAVFSAMVSCSSDDDSPKKEEVSLIGTWNQYKGDFYTTYDNKTQTLYPKGCESQNTVEYNETEVNVVNYDSNNEGKCVPAVHKNAKYTYDKETKKLTHGKVYIVTKITPTELVTEDHNTDWDGDGKYDVTIRYFRKIK
ncbi:hypothetical protein DRF65_27445 [Chryseobacterium pennae]|uniref:Lipocalin-like domain-containing protein n=1 Tax=Chryseobacterium pennae TaxID=2258962 RepID=A0A3D9C0A9_9FLAO|nr:lipocalin family protein [Chryseobacterium pennae]REC59179.1 hypothetical protein DRF65_27445 [Chryseobacterium pennae]